jgi:5-methylcytosine-specific restriction endonuclease McrA
MGSKPGERLYRMKHKWMTTTRAETLAKTGGVCAMCGNAGTDGKGKGLVQAHLVPHSAGGADDSSNLVPLCHPCHNRMDAPLRRRARKESTSATTRLVAGRPAFSASVNPFEDCPAPSLGQQSGVSRG